MELGGLLELLKGNREGETVTLWFGWCTIGRLEVLLLCSCTLVLLGEQMLMRRVER